MPEEPRPNEEPTVSAAGYKRIRDYGVVGNLHTGALVGIDGSVDWYCVPRFDSPSVFASILDTRKGGKFQIAPTGRFSSHQNYREETNVLQTTFQTTTGRAVLTDFMPCFMEKGKLRVLDEFHRLVECVSGEVMLRVTFQPRLNYSRGKTVLVKTSRGCYAKNAKHLLSLSSPSGLQVRREGAGQRIRLEEGRRASFFVEYGTARTKPASPYRTSTKLSKTLKYWKNWARHVKYEGPYRSHVVRSCLVLKLLQYAPTGAIVAAITTSLPECLGGTRNWDYRYSWVRDAAFSIWALTSVGVTGEALDYARWLVSLHKYSNERMQIMRTVTGDKVGPEYSLDHLEGYEGSRPVRLGNSAHAQLQLDIHGVLIDSLFFLHRVSGHTTKQVYETLVRPSADQVIEAWRKPDSGIWEMRGERKLFVESRMWCYIALDRAAKLARELGYHEDCSRWDPIKRRIKSEILTRGWSARKRAFTMTFDGDDLDAANLLMPLAKFLPAKHPKVESTIRRIMEELGSGDLVRRYSANDGLPGREGAFTVCSFWLVDCLARLGRVEDAERLMSQLLGRGNHLGLYSEEIDTETGEALGNFPQAYTHMGLINAAVRLKYARQRSSSKRYVSALSREVKGARKVSAAGDQPGSFGPGKDGIMQVPGRVGVG
ncbi:MAG: hypothetical protein AUJ07_02805 [Crenarchaeota archaeon 13_1_40CM_3_53_5]|nr:MAG: hypothetical protein AUJ07_02805 [Crenarchaeota archaeon 13_1_40CM_3_53_5]